MGRKKMIIRDRLSRNNFSKVQLTGFVLVFAIIGGFVLLQSQAAGGTANVFVSPNGSDSGVNCKRFASAVSNPDAGGTSLCKSFNQAFQLANSGDTIEVESGNYIGPEYVYPNAAITAKVIFRPADGASITIKDASGHGQPVFIKASHVEFDNFPFGYQEFAGSGACGWSCPSHTYGLQIVPPSGATGSYACISDIVIKNASGHSFSINNGVSDVSFIGGTWGNLGWQPGQASDLASSWNAPAIGGSASYKCPDSGTTGAAATNITFNGVHFGNNFQGCQNAAVYGANPQSACVEPTHPDCLHVFGETVGLHIENSWFDHCMGFYLELNVENNYVVDGQALMKDAVFENNIFGDDNAGGYDSWDQLAPGGTGPLYVVCDNVVFRNNTFGHDQSPNPLFGLNCPLASGASQGVQFYNNIFTNWGTSACPSTATFDHNLFVSGSTCGTNAYSGAANFTNPTDSADSTYSWAADPWTSNFHIAAGSAAIAKGLTGQCPSTDFDGASRPAGSACDLGALQYTPIPEVWVSTAGNDTTCARGDQTKPCATWGKAWQIACGGDTVLIAAGTYSNQQIQTDTSCNKGSASPVTFEPAMGASVTLNGVLTLGANNGQASGNAPSGFTLNGLNQLTIHGGAYTWYETAYGSNITLENFHVWHTEAAYGNGGAGDLFGVGGDNLTLKNIEIGPICCNASGIDIGRPAAASRDAQNIVLDHLNVHDVVNSCSLLPVADQPTCSDTYDSSHHVDGLHIWGADGLQITNSKWLNSSGQVLYLEGVNGGQFNNTLIENNMIASTGAEPIVIVTSSSASTYSTTYPLITGYMKILYNSIFGGSGLDFESGSLPGQQWPGPSSLVTIAGNSGILDQPCTGWTGTVVYESNMWSNAQCSGDLVSSTPLFVSSTAPNFDLHLSSGSSGINQATATYCPPTDIDGTTRPQGSACDVGADEYTTGGGSTIPGDLNLDTRVDVFDLSILLSHYGQTATASQGDINGDTKADIFDLSILLSHYGS